MCPRSNRRTPKGRYCPPLGRLRLAVGNDRGYGAEDYRLGKGGRRSEGAPGMGPEVYSVIASSSDSNCPPPAPGSERGGADRPVQPMVSQRQAPPCLCNPNLHHRIAAANMPGSNILG